MKKLLLALTLSSLSLAAFATENCDEIKSQIEAKIKAVGVPSYKLDVVPADAASTGKVVGTCEAGKKKIVYWRL
jgi:translation initiation factor 2 alpha subunit (eIF-2alpha)